MLNHIVIMGRLTRDPVLRRTNSGLAVANFTVAVDRDWPNKETGEKETDFLNCVAWRQTGEFVSKYFTKGSMIVVAGRLQIRKWTDDNGINRTIDEIIANDVYFGESKRNNSTTAAPNTNTNTYSTPSYDYTMIDDDYTQLPF